MLRLEDLLDAREDFQPQLAEFRAAMIDGGIADGSQDAIGYRAGAWDLQKVATCGVKV
jgi:hypothetical protein